MKKLSILFTLVLLFILSGCFSDPVTISSITFNKSPKSTYVLDEIQTSGIEVELQINYKSGSPDTVLMSVDDTGHEILLGNTKLPFTVSGYGEELGEYTLRIELEGYVITYQYRVVENETDALFEAGKGTEQEPYQIKTAQQLSNIRYVDSNVYTYYILVDDIDLQGFDWRSIGTVKYEAMETGYTKVTVESGFYGSLDGDNYSIKNYTVTGDVSLENASYTALFCGSMAQDESHPLMSEMKNVTIKDVNINATNVEEFRASVLFGTAHNIKFNNVHINGNVTIDNSDAGLFLFGAFGSLSANAEYNNCSTDVTLTVKGNTTLYGYGAYVGWEFGKAGHVFKISNCTTNSKVILEDTSTCSAYGSFVGYIYEAADHEYKNNINYQANLITSHDPSKNVVFTSEVFLANYQFSPVAVDADRTTVLNNIGNIKLLARYGGGGIWGGSMSVENCYGYKVK